MGPGSHRWSKRPDVPLQGICLACNICCQQGEADALTTDAAIALLREKEGHLCTRFFKRADGTMLTADCPVGVTRRTRRRRVLAALGASIVSVLAFTGCTKSGSSSASTEQRGQGPGETQCVMGTPIPAAQLNNEPQMIDGRELLGPPREIKTAK